MFGNSQTTTVADMIVPAVQGYNILFFAPPPQAKPSQQVLAELVAANSYPVTAWRISGSKSEPLTFIDPPEAVARYLFAPGGKIFNLDEPTQSWTKHDQWSQHMLQVWMNLRGIKQPSPPLSIVLNV